MMAAFWALKSTAVESGDNVVRQIPCIYDIRALLVPLRVGSSLSIRARSFKSLFNGVVSNPGYYIASNDRIITELGRLSKVVGVLQFLTFI
jgi:hypothetical protein